MFKLKPLLISIFISLGVGGLSGLLTSGSMDIYKSLNLPPFAPPGWVFPVVWSVLYLLMGISAYIIYASDAPNKSTALKVYVVQLAINFIWPLLFFGGQMYLLSFVWLVLLWLTVLLMIIVFDNISATAAWLQLPYLLWVTFAGALNLYIWLNNR